MKPLTCVTNGRIHMTYGPRQRCPKGRAAQSGARPHAGAPAFTRRHRAPRPDVLDLAAPGVSLSRAGTPAQAPCSRWRFQDFLHREAFAQPGRQASCLRRFHRIDVERDRQPGLLGGTASRGRSWLTGRVDNGHCGWNTNLIVCCRRNWLRLMNCSCLPRPGQHAGPPPKNQAAMGRF
jgi:hypothetical protein